LHFGFVLTLATNMFYPEKNRARLIKKLWDKKIYKKSIYGLFVSKTKKNFPRKSSFGEHKIVFLNIYASSPKKN